MDETIQIAVTSEDIETGFPGDPRYCAIVQACNRLFPDKHVEVDGSEIILTTKDRFELEYKYRLPDEAKKFVEAYDRHDQVLPFAFEAHEREYEYY